MVEVFHDMKTIHDNAGLWQFGFDCQGIGFPHIQIDNLDRLFHLRRKPLQPIFECFSLAIGQNFQNIAFFGRAQHQYKVAMSFFQRNFINVQDTDRLALPCCRCFFARRWKMPSTAS
jgi:hypothetical protein